MSSSATTKRVDRVVGGVAQSGEDKFLNGGCVTTRSQSCRYCPLCTQGALATLKRVYLVKRNLYIYSVIYFFPYLMWDITNTLPCRHNVLVVSHGIAGPNRQTPFTGPNKPPHWGRVGENVPGAIYVEAPLNQVDAF